MTVHENNFNIGTLPAVSLDGLFDNIQVSFYRHGGERILIKKQLSDSNCSGYDVAMNRRSGGCLSLAGFMKFEYMKVVTRVMS